MAKAAWIAQQTDARLVRELFPVRKRDTHKGDYGKLLIVGGSVGYTGAPNLCARSANLFLRTGAHYGIKSMLFRVDREYDGIPPQQRRASPAESAPRKRLRIVRP